MAVLTAGQREAYHRDGYLLLERVFDETDVAAMRAESDRLAEMLVDLSLALGAPSPRLDLQRRDGRLWLRKIQPINDVSATFQAVASDQRLLGPLQELLGAEPVLMEEKLVAKQELRDAPDIEAGEDDESFPFHTDLAYYWLDGYPRDTLSSAIAIDGTTAENGPIRVVPGSHLRDWPHREGWPPLIADGAVDESEAVPVLAPAGSVLVFHSALVHASSRNTTDEPRRLIILSHHPAGIDIEPDKRNRPLRERSRAMEARYRALLASGRRPAYRLR